MNGKNDLSILACQINVPNTRSVKHRDDHLHLVQDQVAKALTEKHSDLVMLPELSSIEYSRKSFECLDVLAEDLRGPSYETWKEISNEFNTHVAFSFPRIADDGYRISIAIVAPDGQLAGCYDKIYLAQFGASMEKEFFKAGNKIVCFEIKGFKLAPIICADIRFPELCRTLSVDHNVDIILHSGAYARDPSFHSWHSFALTRALENQVYFVSLNRAGKDYGKSLFCPPWVDEVQGPTHFAEHYENFIQLTIKRSELDHAREAYPFLKDRHVSYS